MKTRKGTTEADTLHGSGVAEKFYGLDGNDIIYGAGGDDRIWGGEGNDVLWGENGRDMMFGDDGDDFLYGGNGGDQLNGDAGNDILAGYAGKDTVKGGAGLDRLFANGGNDVMDGGEDSDSYSVMADAPRITDKDGGETYSIEGAASSAWISDITGSDTIVFEDFEIDEIELKQDGFDLVIRVAGYAEETTISYFFAGQKYKIEEIEVDDGDGGTTDYDLTDIKDGDLSDYTSGSDIWT
jgi:Ca2+-binding RTX toxin-like protein